MPAVTGDVLNPTSLVLPIYTTAQRRALAAEVGTLVYDSTLNKICFSKSATVATASWELVTSAQDA
jgi:hypothetical protein